MRMKKMIIPIMLLALCSCKKYRVCTCTTTAISGTSRGTDTTITTVGRTAIYGTKSYDAAKCSDLQQNIVGTSTTCQLN